MTIDDPRTSARDDSDRRSTDLSNTELRELIKAAQIEGTNAWLEQKFTQFGKWSFYGIAAAAFVFVVKILVKHGQI
ncbi:MAG: hypothetical protein ACSHWQ_00115 [Spongiibacteraceae bacterium]